MLRDNDKIKITQQGFDEIQQEYDRLIKTKRPAVVERLAEARREGDLSENSEYQQARQELGFTEGRITELKQVIERAEVIKIDPSQRDQVALGCQVTVRNGGGKQAFYLVGEWEANPAERKISAGSPLGKSLLGKKVGETVEFEAPAGRINYKIIKID